MPRVRTIHDAVIEIKSNDPGSCLTENALRRFILTGQIPCIQAGGKYLVNLDTLEDFLLGRPLPSTLSGQAGFGGVRKVD